MSLTTANASTDEPQWGGSQGQWHLPGWAEPVVSFSREMSL